MRNRVVTATELKAKCLALLDEVDNRGDTITVTKRGRPVAMLQPVKKKPWKSPRADPSRLSREQTRILNEIIRRRQTVAISAITLLEVAILYKDYRLRSKLSMDELFSPLEASPVFQILPLSIDIAKEVSSLGTTLRDPADRVIVATARVHGLRLLTSDQRIIESNVVSAVD